MRYAPKHRRVGSPRQPLSAATTTSSGPSDATSATEFRRVDRTRNNAALVVLTVLGYSAGVITGPLLSRSLGDAGRGSLAAVITPLSLLVWLPGLGIPSAAGFFANELDPRRIMRSVWWWTFVVIVPITAVVWVLTPRYLHREAQDTINLLRFGLLLVPFFAPTQAAMAIHFVRKGLTKSYLTLVNLPLLANAACVVLLAVSGHLSVRTAVVAWFGSNLAQIVLGTLWMHSVSRPSIDRDVRNKLIRYGARDAVTGSSEMVVGRLDQLVLVGIVSPAVLGHYAVAANIPAISASFAYSVGGIVFGRLRGRAAHGTDSSMQAVYLTAAVSATLSIGLAITTPFLIPMIFGQAFKASVIPLLLLLPGQVCLDSAIVLAQVTRAQGRPGLVSISRAFSAVLMVALIVPVARRYGIRGSAALTSASNLFYLLALLGLRLRAARRASSAVLEGPHGVSPEFVKSVTMRDNDGQMNAERAETTA